MSVYVHDGTHHWCQDNMYSVSLLKKSTDGCYYWPDKLGFNVFKEYICYVDEINVLKMSIPSDDRLHFQAKLQ